LLLPINNNGLSSVELVSVQSDVKTGKHYFIIKQQCMSLVQVIISNNQ